MLYRLSNCYQRGIALALLYVFLFSGLGSLKAQIQVAKYEYFSKVNSLSYERNGKLSNATKQPLSQSSFERINDEEKPSKQLDKRTRANVARKRTLDKINIGGPSQPEMTSFKSVGTDNMVSPFTGDFSYNIPLLDVGGYPVNMFYNSGVTMDQESSWVGLGWNINPGTVTRNMRGLPDDFNGSDKIKKTQSFRDDKTFGLTIGGNIKVAGFPFKLGANAGLAWNNKLGVSAEAGVNAAISISGKNAGLKNYALTASAGLNASSRGGASVSPSISIQKQMGNGQYGNLSGSIGVGYNYSSRMGLTSMHLDMNISESYKKGGDEQSINWGGSSGTLSFAYPSVVPSITKPITRENYSLELSGGGELYSVNLHGKIKGYLSKIYIAPEDKISEHPAFGMLHLQGAEKNNDALMDFNRANDGMYTPNTPTIAMPVYTYDVFSINGEGTGGSFRAYRGDVGHMRDPNVRTKENSYGLGVDLGFGNLVHVGADLNYVQSPNESGDWKTGNMASSAVSFQNSNGSYQSSYFKNPSEKTVPDMNFQNAVGGDDLVRFKLANTASANPMLLPKLIRYDAFKNQKAQELTLDAEKTKKARDKRTQVISFLNAEEAERIGMNKKLYSYNSLGSNENKVIYSVNCNKSGIDSFYRNHNDKSNAPQMIGEVNETFRKKHHISEINVLSTDGKKYVYGLPVYNKKQVNVTFSIDANQKVSNTKAQYEAGDNTENNARGRDWVVEKEEIPSYTHSFMLTELTSPNYVDVTGNGITEDDMGEAVKFNYSKYNDYKWRTPFGTNSANYNSGLKTDEKDDKANYVYGEREQWYLYSVESKNMVARFYVKSDRKDGLQVTDENGTLDSDGTKGMRRLDKIQLFSKGDLVKFGDNAKPIKTVRFFQSYKLCKNNTTGSELSSNTLIGQGKLTLDSIWVSYSGNTAKPKSKYVFFYPDNNNPSYSFEQSDRWGTFKPTTDNPNGLLNEDYPYALQDKAKADKNAAAWALNKILLPSGGVLTIDYESDSYAYVQNKKSASMSQVIGFGKSSTVIPAASELPKLYTNSGLENDIVYVQLSTAITSTGAAARSTFGALYLEDIKQLYLKLAVTMPTGSGLSGIAGEETIPVYADILDYGIINSTTAWIKVADIGTGHTPMVQGALQFLQRQLPGKAYKGYDVSEEGGLKAIITAMGGMLGSIGSMFNGEINTLKNDKKCQQVLLTKSFVKLTNPWRNKLGGGHRVKRIVMSDNWDKMTGQMKATYGKEYRYETKELVNGKLETISSGVASWEPSIGGDENPLRDIMRFVDHNKGGPYDYGTIETPLGETFYPSAGVGYSRVEVLSIHRDTVKNQPTRQVTEFYTNKEFPYKSSCTDLKGEANAKYEPAKIMQLLRIDMMKGISQSQGFLIETNDMHGKEKSNAVYTVTDPINPTTYTQYFYNVKQLTDKSYTFNHDFSVLNKADGVVSSAVIGKDVEVMTDFRENHSETITANLSINFDGFIVGFFPIPLTNLLQPVVREGTMYRSAAILKLVTHYGMVDSVVTVDKGSMVSTKNLIFDSETGNPLLTRTQNEFNKQIYNFSYPAHWAYSGMGNAYKNIDATYEKLSFRHGTVENAPVDLFNILESGDEIYVVKKGSDTLTRTLPCDDPNAPYDVWNSLRNTQTNKIWAVNMQKVGAGSPQWVFMDADGNPFNANYNLSNGEGASIRIVRSGKRNMIDQSVGTITSLNNPIVNGQLVFNDATGILQNTAATFKDNWRVDNRLYRVSEQTELKYYARVKRADLIPEDFAVVQKAWRRNIGGSQCTGFWPFYNAGDNRNCLGTGFDNYSIEKNQFLDLYKYSKDVWNSCCRGGGYTDVRETKKAAFLKYSYASIPVSSILYKAELSLFSHTNSLFSSPPFPSANHPNLHNPSTSSNNSAMMASVRAINNNWFGTANSGDAYNWANNYINNSSLSSGFGLIPNTLLGNNNYSAHGQRINVTLPILTRSNAILDAQKKIGLKLSLWNETWGIPSGQELANFRCFWSPAVNTPCYNTASVSYKNAPPVSQAISCNVFQPKLYYYYFNWGDTTLAVNQDNDPSVNTMLTKYILTYTNTYCKSKFDRKAMNPYVEGVLGNWRVDTTYVYYGDRKETDPTLPTPIDTRVAGTIKNYKTFWSFASAGGNTSIPVYLVRNQQGQDVWVWNNAITQYNRKGFEIENTDPIGRFNSGLYGYNQQLPIAVANNSRVRELLYDGFEDYDYQTASNCINCPPNRAFTYAVPITSKIDASQKHTGRYSLRVDVAQNVTITAPVVSLATANTSYGLKIQNATTNYTNQYLGYSGTNGTGLKASWFNHIGVYPQLPVLEPAPSNTFPQATLIYTNPAMNPNVPSGNAQTSPVVGVSPEYFSVKWEGKIQAPATGIYRFRTIGDNGTRVKIGNNVISNSNTWTSGAGNGTTQDVSMIVGQTYNIEISFYNQWGPYQFSIQWNYNSSNGYLYPGTNNFYIIPIKHLYVPSATSFQQVITTQQTCYRLDSSQVIGNALTDSFSLIQSRKMLLSGWVKVGIENCCFPATYDNNSNNITLSFMNSAGAISFIPAFKPSGVIIEGWQRYESVFDVPASATKIFIAMNNTTTGTGTPVYFDDVRVQPYNANMKSFVYHSGNMRLMAELDENNYSSFYEYDDDGVLSRIKKETQMGIKTIKETRAATQKNVSE